MTGSGASKEMHKNKETHGRFMTIALMMTLLLLIFGYSFRNEKLLMTFDALSSTSSSPSSKFSPSPSSSAPCTFALFRQAFKRAGHSPAGGKWYNETTKVPYYQPDICKFRYPRVPHSLVSECLEKANISYMVTMGDSTCSRYYQALLKTSTLKFTIVRQEVLREGGFLPDKEYFAKIIPDEVMEFVKEKFRFCSGCRSKLSETILRTHNNAHILLNLEHIAQTMILDDSLQISFPAYNETKNMDKIWAITMQELILRYYLSKQQPDVFLIFLPFMHAKRNIPLSRLPLEIEYFKGLVEEYLPKKTKLIYMPAHSEHEEARKKNTWKNRLFEGMLAAEKINRMNHILYRVIENDILNASGRYYGFLDLYHISKDLDSWSMDGVHLNSKWYESVMSMFWETYCNSVLMDAF